MGYPRNLVDEDIVRLILDGTVIKTRIDKKATNISVLAAIGVRRDGPKELLSIKNMGGESKAAWGQFLGDLDARGQTTGICHCRWRPRVGGGTRRALGRFSRRVVFQRADIGQGAPGACAAALEGVSKSHSRVVCRQAALGRVGPALFLNRDVRRMTRDGFAYRLRQHVATAERSTPSIAAKHVTPLASAQLRHAHASGHR